MDDLMHASMAALDGEPLPGRDLFIVAQYLMPTEAHLAQGCLAASGIPAVVADDNLVQTYSLIAPAVGGVRVMVPASFVEQARQVLAAMERGEFALGDDADVGERL